MFLAMVSHELRAPLNVILPWIQMMQKKDFDPANKIYALSAIERNANLQKQLIDDLLDVSQIAAGKFQVETRPVEIVPIIEDAVLSVTPALEAKGIKLQCVFGQNNPSVLGDARRLQQVIWNLLSNAVKFTPEGGRIELRAESAGANIRIIVGDSGIGIAEDFLPYVFDDFFQGDNAVKSRLTGLGLGLSIVRHVVKAHGGAVRAESQGEGLGSTFTIELPLISARETLESKPVKLSETSPVTELSLI